MTPRTFLVHGLIAGILAGAAAFLVAHQVGEPQVGAAIALEEAGGHDHAADHADEAPLVSRATQRTWGLGVGSLAVGTALGGVVALAAAAAVGRIGRMTPGQSTAVVAAVGFVAVGLVPFLKYPADPPGVGSGDTIGARSADYFGFLLVSVVAAGLAVALAQRVWRRHGAYAAVVAGTAAYLVPVVVAAHLLPTVDGLDGFPADTLWYFRRASLLTQVALWGVLGLVLTGLVDRRWVRHTRDAARRELAASL